MAIGKSGKHYNNPHTMRGMGDGPDESMGEEREQQQEAGADEQAPAMQAHEIRKHDDGSYSSKDGGEHADFHEAVHHMAEKFGEKCPVCGDEDEQAAEPTQSAAIPSKDAAASLYEA